VTWFSVSYYVDLSYQEIITTHELHFFASDGIGFELLLRFGRFAALLDYSLFFFITIKYLANIYYLVFLKTKKLEI
jgi:hypothetical protein